MGVTKKDAKLIWDDDCEQAFLALKKTLVQAYPIRDGSFVLSTDTSDTGMGAVLEQEQEEDGKVGKKVIAYAFKTLYASQQRYCTTNKELFTVVTTVELFEYYLTWRHFTVVTDHASLTHGSEISRSQKGWWHFQIDDFFMTSGGSKFGNLIVKVDYTTWIPWVLYYHMTFVLKLQVVHYWL